MLSPVRPMGIIHQSLLGFIILASHFRHWPLSMQDLLQWDLPGSHYHEISGLRTGLQLKAHMNSYFAYQMIRWWFDLINKCILCWMNSTCRQPGIEPAGPPSLTAAQSTNLWTPRRLLRSATYQRPGSMMGGSNADSGTVTWVVYFIAK